ncbi:uncharacterized protein LOC106088640 [Stomoxys calcitrans]|uniref:uncharacterized protein LOC106088640 n=1 Tax=Stomoxys calcitrans TaxID=35570 RepID=UPI0027E2E21C|nr:uncharacterized protein LOC106088640 [Stomoxys calcitrans]
MKSSNPGYTYFSNSVLALFTKLKKSRNSTMLRKRQRLKQIKEIHPRPVTVAQNNAKVTVQYIQPQKRSVHPPVVIEIPHTSNSLRNHDGVEQELEIENIEYLDETNVQLVEDDDAPTDDIFYPNAIHCLLDLYKAKYDQLPERNISKKALRQFWLQIASEMQERFFEFGAQQLQRKYATLRAQYFALNSAEDVDNFEYFHELHNIYDDPSKSVLVDGGVTNNNSSSPHKTLYKDENLIVFDISEKEGEIEEEHNSNFQSEEIVHKEHEFINMVVAMKEAPNVKPQVIQNTNSSNNTPSVKEYPIKAQKVKYNLKRNIAEIKKNKDDEQPPTKQKPTGLEDTLLDYSPSVAIHNQSVSLSDSSQAESMTLRLFNIEQEKRHREQMALLDRQFKQQQLALENINLHLQELIKRMPPAL